MRRRGVFEDEVYRTIGERIGEMRRTHGMSLDALSTAMGVTESSLHNAEIGQTCSIMLLMRLADHFDCSLDDLCPVVTAA